MTERLPTQGESPWDTVLGGYLGVEHNTDGTHKYAGFNVKNYGAVGDGTTDDTAALTAAVAAAASAGVVYFPPGTYKYVSSAQLDVPSNVTLQGYGWGSVISISATGAGGGIRFPSGSSNCGLADITIKRGTATATRLVDNHAANARFRNVQFVGNSLTGHALTMGSGANGTTVNNCLFTGINGNGILALAVSGVGIIGNSWQGHLGASAPILFNGDMTRYQIADNTLISDATATGASILVVTTTANPTCTYGVIANNYVEAVAEAIDVQATQAGSKPLYCSIFGNMTKQLAAAGGVGGISVIMERGSLTGNTIDLNDISATGIEMNQSSYNTIIGNMCYGLDASPNPIILEGSSHCTVSGNVVYGFKDTASAGSSGIYLRAEASPQDNCNDNTVTGNMVVFAAAAAGTLEAGILLQTATADAHVDRNVITGNQVYGNNVTNSRGISLDNSVPGTVDKNLVGMNGLHNLTAPLHQSGDTNTLYSGSIWNATGSLTATATTALTAYTFALTDSEKTVEFTSAAAVSATIPPNSSVGFLLGTVIEIYQYGAGQVTVVAGAGVTIRSPSAKVKLTGQYSAAVLRKRGTDEWVLEGDIAA